MGRIDVIATSAGWAVAWTAPTSNGHTDAFFQQLDAAGVPIGGPLDFTTSIANAALVDVSIAHGPSGYVAIVSGGGTWRAAIADDGTLALAPVSVDARTPSWVDLAAGPDGFAMAWSNASSAYVQTLGADSTPIGSLPIPTPEEDLAIAWDGASWAVVEAGQLGRAHAQVVLLRGAALTTTQVVDDVGVSGDPGGSVSMSLVGNDFLVSWRRGGSAMTYPLALQRYGAGTSSSGTLRVRSVAREIIVARDTAGSAATFVTSDLILLGWSNVRAGASPEAYAMAVGIPACAIGLP